MRDAANNELRLLFPTAVQVSQIDNHEKLNARLMDVINVLRRREPNTKPQSWSCDLYTTIGSPRTFLEEPGIGDFAEIALQKANEFANALQMDTANHKPRINECWVNVYSHSHAQDVHIHQNSVISGIYFVKAPPGSAPTLFHSPTADVMLAPPITGNNQLNASIAGFEAAEGRMLLFRSSLRHNVLPSQIHAERVTIAFNVTM